MSNALKNRIERIQEALAQKAGLLLFTLDLRALVRSGPPCAIPPKIERLNREARRILKHGAGD
jgi:hypothetical protein